MEPNVEVSQEEFERIKIFLTFLKHQGIKLICLDFDYTVCSVWTDGRDKNLNKIRPVFISLYQISRELGIHIAITTFHPLTDRVREEVSKAFNVNGYSLVVKNQMNSKLLSNTYWLDGKGPMIEGAWSDIFRRTKINYGECFLIDDDENNIKKANEMGCPSLHFEYDSKDLTVFLKSIEIKANSSMEMFIKHKKIDNSSPKGRKIEKKEPICHQGCQLT